MKRYFATVNVNNSSNHNAVDKDVQVQTENSGTKTNQCDSVRNSNISDCCCDSQSENENFKRKKYNQKYKTEWENSFTWLKRVGESAFCRYCFVALTNNITLLKRHEETTSHKRKQSDCTKNFNIIETMQKRDSVQQHHMKLKTEITLTMYCLKHHLTFSLMDSLPDLLKVSCPDPDMMDIHCKRTKATALVKNIIAPYCLEKISSDLRNSVFSLIIDETTDVSTIKTLVLVVRLFDSDSKKIKDKFFALVQVKKADAEGIYSAIVTKLKQQNIPLKNMIGLASDNASVMSGNINGVKTKLQRDNKSLFYMGCLCHSLHLIASAASKVLPARLHKNIKNIYAHFAHSSKRQDDFKDFQELFKVMQHKILKLVDTRWLSYEGVVNRTLEQWQALTHYFMLFCFEENRAHSSNASEILDFLQNTDNKLYLHFLSYILKIINKINKLFQSEATQIHIMIKVMRDLMLDILKNFIKPQFCKNMEVDYQNVDFQVGIPYLYCGLEFEAYIQEMKLDSERILNVKKNIQKFYIELCNQIKKRIDLFDKKLNMLRYIDPEIIASGELPSILPLLDLFPYYEESAKQILNEQWRSLIAETETIIQHKGENIVSTWTNLGKIKNLFGEFSYKVLAEYMIKLATLPHSSSAAERIFSDINLFKTKKTNRLSIETMENILLSKLLIDSENQAIWIPSDDLLKYASRFNYHAGKFIIN